MYQYFISNPIIALVFIVFGFLVLAFLIVKKVQNTGLEKIRKIVYDAFIVAEHEFQYGDNTQKFEYVIKVAKKHLPKPFGMFITESLLRKVIQLWFDLIKDLLDDGKINGITKY